MCISRSGAFAISVDSFGDLKEFAIGRILVVVVGDGYSFRTDTSVALIMAKTLSPSLRFIRLTEPVVIIDVMFPAAVRMTSSDTTLSETIFSIVPGKRFRMLVLMVDSFPQLGSGFNSGKCMC